MNGILSSGWGGSRHHGDKVSHHLTASQVTNLIEATAYACAIGLPFNRHTTIHLGKLGIADSEAAKAVSSYLKLMRDWIVRRGGYTAYIWMRENDAEGSAAKGTHVHILWHLPPHIRLRSMTHRWAQRVAQGSYVKRAILTHRIIASDHIADFPELYQANLRNVLGYLLKGASPLVAHQLGLARHSEGGAICGKRCGTSENIGGAARMRNRPRSDLSLAHYKK